MDFLKMKMTPEEFGDVMDVGDLVAVHLTKYFPEGGRIKTLNTNFPEDTLRNTIHFSLNHPVGNAGFYGNWDGTRYAVIVPLDSLCKEPENQLWNFNVVDTYFVGDVTLPEGSMIVNSTPFHPSNEELAQLTSKGIRYILSLTVC